MKFRIKIHKIAQAEIKDAIYWYGRQQQSLGEQFEATVKDAVDFLSSFPYFAIRYGKYRCKQVGSFPYLLHFSIDEEKGIVKVHGLKQTSRDPKKTWKDEA